MAILAIDTSTIVSGAAIVQKDKLVAEIIMQLKLPQSEVLLGHVQDVLKIAHMDKSDLTGVAIVAVSFASCGNKAANAAQEKGFHNHRQMETFGMQRTECIKPDDLLRGHPRSEQMSSAGLLPDSYAAQCLRRHTGMCGD